MTDYLRILNTGDQFEDGFGVMYEVTDVNRTGTSTYPITARAVREGQYRTYSAEGRFRIAEESDDDIFRVFVKQPTPQSYAHLDSRDYFVKILGGVL